MCTLVAASDSLLLNLPVCSSFPESCAPHFYYLRKSVCQNTRLTKCRDPFTVISDMITCGWSLAKALLDDSRFDLQPQHPSTTEAQQRDVSSSSSGIQDFHTRSLKALRAQSTLSSGYTQANIACSEYNGGFITRFSPWRPAVVHVSHKVSGAPVQPVCNTIYEERPCLPCAGCISSFQVQVIYFLSDCINAGWERKGGGWGKAVAKTGGVGKELQWDRIQTPQEQ